MCFNLRKASRAITQVYDNLFKKVGISPTQASILHSIRALGPITVTQMAEALATDRTTITRNLKPLEREKMIKICCGQDKRERCINITQKGIDYSDKAIEVWQGFQGKVVKAVGKNRMDKLRSDLFSALEIIQKI